MRPHSHDDCIHQVWGRSPEWFVRESAETAWPIWRPANDMNSMEHEQKLYIAGESQNECINQVWALPDEWFVQKWVKT